MNFLLSSAVQLLLALLLDHWLGEFNRWHPLVGFGRFARWVEARLYPDSQHSTRQTFVLGLLALIISIVPIALTTWWLVKIPVLGWCLEVFLLYIVIGWNSLIRHAQYVYEPLQSGDLEEAREKVGWIVSRQTGELQPPQIIRATIESVLENGNDAVFGAIFWFMVAGAPGAVVYRMANTLDAMWGYKNERFLFFGRAAARFDDILNLIPGQLCALTYAVFGNVKKAVNCWFTQAPRYKSFNGGSVMASGAASLGFRLGGEAVYHGKKVSGVTLGEGRLPDVQDIKRATDLVTKGVVLWACCNPHDNFYC